jgi:hypothetical protein
MPKFTEPLLIPLGPPTMALLRDKAERDKDSAWWTANYAPYEYDDACSVWDILNRHQDKLELLNMWEFVSVADLAEEVFGNGYVVKTIEDAADRTELEGE